MSFLLNATIFLQKVKSYITAKGQSVNLSICHGAEPQFMAQDQIFISLSCGFVDVMRPL
jgi:hypothetical protein